MHEIPFSEIPGLQVGQTEDRAGGTGCTVLLTQDGARAGIDVRGGGPASRDTELLRPEKTVQEVHAVVLSGGSAFGLDACGGVMRALEEKGIGFDVGVGDAVVPIVCGASIFDLGVGSLAARPGAEAGLAACRDAFLGKEPRSGNFGAGTGASVGKFAGAARAMKSGIGFYALSAGPLILGAAVCVNALGDVQDYDTGRYLAGLLSEDGRCVSGTLPAMFGALDAGGGTKEKKDPVVTNTTIGCVITNADLSKAACTKLAQISHDGLARTISPVHTSLDGDTMFALSTGHVPVHPDLAGAAAVEAVGRAVNRAVLAAEAAYGLPAASDLKK